MFRRRRFPQGDIGLGITFSGKSVKYPLGKELIKAAKKLKTYKGSTVDSETVGLRCSECKRLITPPNIDGKVSHLIRLHKYNRDGTIRDE